MRFWMWNAGLSAEALKREVVLSVLARTNALAAGPSCSLFREVQGCERRLEWEGQCRGEPGDHGPHRPGDRRRYGQRG